MTGAIRSVAMEGACPEHPVRKIVQKNADVKKRIKLPVKENFTEYDDRLKVLLKQMRDCLKQGMIPGIRKGQKCGGCSMRDLCMPGLKKIRPLKEQIDQIRREDL